MNNMDNQKQMTFFNNAQIRFIFSFQEDSPKLIICSWQHPIFGNDLSFESNLQLTTHVGSTHFYAYLYSSMIIYNLPTTTARFTGGQFHQNCEHAGTQCTTSTHIFYQL